MFLFNFYSNNDLYITIYLMSLVLSVVFFGLSVMFDSRRIFFLFVSATVFSFLLNIHEIPVDLVVIFFIASLFPIYKIEGKLKYKIFINIFSFFIIMGLTGSGIYSITNFIENGDFSDQTFMKQKFPKRL